MIGGTLISYTVYFVKSKLMNSQVSENDLDENHPMFINDDKKDKKWIQKPAQIINIFKTVSI